jgi:hypothetical protein
VQYSIITVWSIENVCVSLHLSALYLFYPNCTPCPTDEAHRHTGEVALLGHTGHTVTNGVLGVLVCYIFFSFNFLKKMVKKSKLTEAKSGGPPRASKRKQQSAPVASGVSVPEKAKKPKGVATETTILSVSSPTAEVGKETSAINVAEEEQKMPALPKYAAVLREVFGAGAVPVGQSVGVEAVEGQGVAGEKLEEAEDENKDDDDDDDDSGSGEYEEEEESGDEGSDYAPPEDGSEGTVNHAVDAVAHVDNLPDEVKPSQMEKVSSPFDLPILHLEAPVRWVPVPAARTH